VLTHESDLVGEIGDAVAVVAGGGVVGPITPEDFLASGDYAGLVPDYAEVLRRVAVGCGASAAVLRSPQDAAAALLRLIPPR